MQHTGACSIEALVELGKGDTTTGSGLSACWKLLWTTEKETLFILKKAGLFGTKAGEVYQAIDMQAGTLQNVITFPPDGAFVVDSSIEVASSQRTNFTFNAATLQLHRRSIKLPPYGQGWFETVYLDKNIRVAKDSRGDTLVVVRDGPCRRF
ncbi:hypothetical protein WJX72_006110 [[Myrmecia] bisecta]|uniref:Plastid lipid-associated protein/fibrillin conserved domain-containing protein n=1 Tax=[Myrmecia] bisecta TaxID=41462 RepID=A0AAW1P430_9CHLO